MRVWLLTLLFLFSKPGYALEGDPSFLAERKSGAVYTGNMFPEARVKFQDQLALEASQGGRVTSAPKITFTAGGYGAGKSTILKKMVENGILIKEDYVEIDADVIKQKIPEYANLIKVNNDDAATLVHEESMAIAQLALERSMSEGKNIIFDSSLSYAPYYQELIERIRKTHPQYSIEILYVKPDIEKVIRAAQDRALIDGRFLSEKNIIKSIEMVKPSVEKITPKVDRLIQFQNNYDGKPTLELIQTPSKITKVDLPLDGNLEVKKLLTEPIEPKSLENVRHVVFDIDNTIGNVPGAFPKGFKDDWKWVEVEGTWYRVPENFGATVQKLIERKVKISFVSGGSYERNLAFLKKVKPPELGGKSLYDIAYRSLSKNDLKDQFPNSKIFAKRWQKDLRLISPDLKNVVLVDDRLDFIKHSGSDGIQFGKTYDHFETWGEAHLAKKAVSPELSKWIPATKEEWLRDRNRFARIYSILERALNETEKGSKKSFAELAGQYDREPELPWIENGLKKLRHLPTGKDCFQSVMNQAFLNP